MISLMTAASYPKIEKSNANQLDINMFNYQSSITIIVNSMLINKPVYDR
jgi:hypothetical protein